MFLSLEISSNIVKDIVQNCKKTCNLCEENEKQLDIIKKNDFSNRKQIVQKKNNYNFFNVYSSQTASNFSPSFSSSFSVHHFHHIFSFFIKEFFHHYFAWDHDDGGSDSSFLHDVNNNYFHKQDLRRKLLLLIDDEGNAHKTDNIFKQINKQGRQISRRALDESQLSNFFFHEFSIKCIV